MKGTSTLALVAANASQLRSTGPADTELGLRIRRTRSAAKLSQEELANRIGISCQQLQKYEAAINRVSVARLIDIADALGVDVAHLLRDDEPPSAIAPGEPEQFLRLQRSFIAIRNEMSRQKVVELAEFLEKLEQS